MQLSHDEITRLSPVERLDLIGQLWDSLADGQVPLTAEQTAEIDHRLATLDHDRQHAVTWASLKAELDKRTP
jgi:putative addiction module component (TIGR02574 family)